MTSNPELSLRTPKATSLSRSTSFNRKEFRERFQFAANIYNCDETRCTTVQECPKVIASKHVSQVGQVTSAERGSLVTVCFAVNALGNAIPSFFIFPRVKYNESYVASGPPVSQGDSYPSGWMTTKSLSLITHKSRPDTFILKHVKGTKTHRQTQRLATEIQDLLQSTAEELSTRYLLIPSGKRSKELSSTWKIPSRKSRSYCWTEEEYAKDSNLIVSAVYHGLCNTDFPTESNQVRLMADGCSGQNKNSMMMAMLSKWLTKDALAHIRLVEVTFPVVDYSFLPPDSVCLYRKRATESRKYS
ncbi:unnamed protein product [Pieris macdunnoughi]|uniref:Uncharacterized protein n=1 Tax=Pieris macdunnoughi TaxID=345717 RepID=A0A821UHT0_9NEOP|nr:unnamed protein product [Pieris macdunnoughi]